MIETTTRTCMRCRIVFPFCRVPHCCSQAVLDVSAGYCCLRVPFCCCSSGSIVLLSVASVFSIPQLQLFAFLLALTISSSSCTLSRCHCDAQSTISRCYCDAVWCQHLYQHAPPKDTAVWPVWSTVSFQSPVQQVSAVSAVSAVCILSIKLF